MKGDLMPGPILCGVDDSTGARDAVVAASAISIRAALPLMFVHVAPDESRLSRRDPERKRRIGESVAVAIEMLGRATSRLPSGHGAITRVALGDPAEQLAAVAAASGAEMVVVGSRGRRRVRAAVLGSVSRALTVLSGCPVLIVPPGASIPEAHVPHDPRHRRSVLCGIDGSQESTHAAVVASGLAARLGDRLVLVHAHAPLRTGLTGRYDSGDGISLWRSAPTLLSAATVALARLGGPDPEARLEPGDPRDALIRAARRERAELLVLGLHADRPALRRSVAGALLASSSVPILIVPSPNDLARGATGPAGEPEHVATAA
jgi:nucleotide-binding universal stress UspA family protein